MRTDCTFGATSRTTGIENRGVIVWSDISRRHRLAKHDRIFPAIKAWEQRLL